MVGTKMAFSAGFRLARLGLGETMPCVASAAASPTAVGIDATDTGIGPSRWIEFATGQHLDRRAMALEAAGRHCRRTAYHLAQKIVERGEDLSSFGMMAPPLLINLFLVTTSTARR